MKQLFIDFKQFNNFKCNLEGFSIIKESEVLKAEHDFYLVNNQNEIKEKIYNIDFFHLYNLGFNVIQEIINEKVKESKTYKFLQLNEKVKNDTQIKRKVKI